MSRQTLYTEELAEIICDRLMEGESLVKICADESMPHRRTVIRWMAADAAFATKCARARDEQAELMDDKILDTAEASTPETAASDRVKISAYQWRASKLKPKKYGDRVDLTHANPDGSPLLVQLINYADRNTLQVQSSPVPIAVLPSDGSGGEEGGPVLES